MLINNTLQKIRILHFICPAGLFGAERWILALAKNYINNPEVDCRLAVSSETQNQNISVYEKYREFGLHAYKVSMKGRFDPNGIWSLKKLIEREGIDIIHTHGYKSDIFGLIAAKLTRKKIVATSHGFENVKDLKLQFFIKLGGIALRYCDAVSPLSAELTNDIARIKVKPEKIHLIINGVDLDEVETFRSAQNEPAKEFQRKEKIIGYIGQLASRKNIATLIDAFDLLYKVRKDVRLLLIGDGPLRNDLEQKAKLLESGSHIEFLGYRDDRLQFVKHMDIFCMTSSLEGIPRCMMEAMAMGRPAVAFQIPGIDKLIIDKETGLLATYGDIEALVKSWQIILSDQEFAAKVGMAGRRHILEHFSARRMADEYAVLYKKMLTS